MESSILNHFSENGKKRHINQLVKFLLKHGAYDKYINNILLLKDDGSQRVRIFINRLMDKEHSFLESCFPWERTAEGTIYWRELNYQWDDEFLQK